MCACVHVRVCVCVCVCACVCVCVCVRVCVPAILPPPITDTLNEKASVLEEEKGKKSVRHRKVMDTQCIMYKVHVCTCIYIVYIHCTCMYTLQCSMSQDTHICMYNVHVHEQHLVSDIL